jgi:hypothetical protein
MFGSLNFLAWLQRRAAATDASKRVNFVVRLLLTDDDVTAGVAAGPLSGPYCCRTHTDRHAMDLPGGRCSAKAGSELLQVVSYSCLPGRFPKLSVSESNDTSDEPNGVFNITCLWMDSG